MNNHHQHISKSLPIRGEVWWGLFLFLLLSVSANAQIARTFTVSVSADNEATMQVYIPQYPTGRAIVDCPGGGYSRLSMENEGHNWKDFFAERGIVFGVLKYRMPKGDRTVPMGDAQAAIKMMRDSADRWQVNPHDVGIMGFSAGGHLASTTATHALTESLPDFQILFYPVISMDEKETHKGSCVNFLGEDRSKPDICKLFSNWTQVRTHRTPPAILLLSQDDKAVPPLTNAIPYFNAMTKKGIPCTMHIYPSGGHGWGFRDTFAYHEDMKRDLTTWLNNLKAPSKNAIRVACIGNSITYGHGIHMPDVNAYPAQLQRMLGSAYCVRNFGVSGRTLLNSGNRPYMKESAWREAQLFLPNIAVIKLGTNDSKPLNWNKHGKEFAADLQAMIDTLNALPSKPTIYLCTPLIGNHQPPADQMSNQCRDQVVVSEIIPQILAIAKRNNLKVIDLHPVVNLDEKDMQPDMLHPTAEGDKKIAAAVCGAIK